VNTEIGRNIEAQRRVSRPGHDQTYQPILVSFAPLSHHALLQKKINSLPLLRPCPSSALCYAHLSDFHGVLQIPSQLASKVHFWIYQSQQTMPLFRTSMYDSYSIFLLSSISCLLQPSKLEIHHTKNPKPLTPSKDLVFGRSFVGTIILTFPDVHPWYF